LAMVSSTDKSFRLASLLMAADGRQP
jgi:hypothetical protein